MGITSAKSTKTFIACYRCKSRKRRCDGRQPACSNCVGSGAICDYAAVRKTRGPGKKASSSSIVPSTSCIAAIPDTNAPVSVISSFSGASIEVFSMDLYTEDRSSVFPEFLRPDVFQQNLALFKQYASEAAAIRGFTSLIPLVMARRLISYSFTDFMGTHNLIEQSTFMAHLEEQYSESCHGPAGNPMRWALVSSILGLATRFKIAPGAEAELSDIPLRLFHNARMVLSDFILLEPSLLSMQALLAMALFAQAVQDEQALIMLMRNASSQLEQFRKANRSEEYMDTTNLEKIIQKLGH